MKKYILIFTLLFVLLLVAACEKENQPILEQTDMIATEDLDMNFETNVGSFRWGMTVDEVLKKHPYLKIHMVYGRTGFSYSSVDAPMFNNQNQYHRGPYEMVRFNSDGGLKSIAIFEENYIPNHLQTRYEFELKNEISRYGEPKTIKESRRITHIWVTSNTIIRLEKDDDTGGLSKYYEDLSVEQYYSRLKDY